MPLLKKKKPAIPIEYKDDKLVSGIFRLMRAHRNTLLIGGAGVGKTTIVSQVAGWLGYSMKLLNASTLDPYADLAGIPVVNAKQRMVEFIHDINLDEYDVFFIDEINRPSHPKVLNGLLELIQFRSVQGRPFSKLKVVFAAMNPPNQNYNVEDLDLALMDRFHNYITIPKVYSLPYFTIKFGGTVGPILIKWAKSLTKDKQETLTPRRLDYIGESLTIHGDDIDLLTSTMIDSKINKEDFIALQKMIKSLEDGAKETEVARSLDSHISQQNNISRPKKAVDIETNGDGDGSLLGCLPKLRIK